MILTPGTRLGRYTVVELLATGGMGEVYRASDTSLGREVAIKVLPEHLSSDAAALDRFRREARTVASLSHPAVLSIFDFGTTENGIAYAVTELLDGETLRHRMIRGRMPGRDAVELMADVCDGVAVAHERGIIHRDLKPENIFLTTDGRAKVLDFGLARLVSAAYKIPEDGHPTEALPTAPGVIIGTVGYIAPEQIDGRTLGPQADVFALGCMLYELLTGRLPFVSTSPMRLLVSTLHDDPAPLDSDDAFALAAEPVVARCLEKDPTRRYASAAELANDLRELLALAPTSRLSATSTAFLRRMRRRRRGLFITIAFIVALIAVGAWIATAPQRTVLDSGYDLRASDIRDRGETRRLVALALRADAEGKRPKAAELFDEAWRKSKESALPAAFLAVFSDVSGDRKKGAEWSARARARIPGASAYESLMVRYLTRAHGEDGHEFALAKSILELRPAAWRMRLAAAHLQLARRQPAAALAELREIDVRKPDDARLSLVLADRASLGDIDGAERDLQQSRLPSRPALMHYTQGRIAWSRGDARKAGEHYEKAAEAAVSENLVAVELQSRHLGAIARIAVGDFNGAANALAVANARSREEKFSESIFLSEVLAGYVAWRAGDMAERDRSFEKATAFRVHLGYHAALYILAIRTGSPQWRLWQVPNVEEQTDLAGVARLIDARVRWAAGDRPGAELALRQARAEGIATTGFLEETELLAAELGLPANRLKADPPYPNLLRWLAVFDLARR